MLFLLGKRKQVEEKGGFVCVCVCLCEHGNVNLKSESEVAQSCPTLCDPMDYSPPGSSLHGILQARVLEWVVISFSKGS